jgi:hypothetical protein
VANGGAVMPGPAMIPVLPAYLAPDGIHLLVWCDHCRRYHRHRAPISAAPRLAHCADASSSPYSRSGYKLRDAGPAPREVIRAADQYSRR